MGSFGPGSLNHLSKILAQRGYRLEGFRRPIVMARKGILFIFCFLLPSNCYAQNNGFSLGYGFGVSQLGKIEGNRSYNFLQAAYSHEFQIIKDFFFVGEPYLAYINEPDRGMDIGLGLFLRYYLRNFFFSLGGGGAYTGVHFQEQTHHYLFMLQGGIGYKWKNFFIEDRFRHYSNAGLASPNHSINANILSIGILF
jgi:hypothetical protein